MGDHGDYWNDVKQGRKEKKAENREKSPELLQEYGVAFESKNGGAHLIVKHGRHTIDFWPGTGKWRERNGISSRGVKRLLAHIGAKPLLSAADARDLVPDTGIGEAAQDFIAAEMAGMSHDEYLMELAADQDDETHER